MAGLSVGDAFIEHHDVEHEPSPRSQQRFLTSTDQFGLCEQLPAAAVSMSRFRSCSEMHEVCRQASTTKTAINNSTNLSRRPGWRSALTCLRTRDDTGSESGKLPIAARRRWHHAAAGERFAIRVKCSTDESSRPSRPIQMKPELIDGGDI